MTTTMNNTPEPPVFDPDCRDGKHTSCIGDICECGCHEAPAWLTFTDRDATDGGEPE